jgi:hypothetical protein
MRVRARTWALVGALLVLGLRGAGAWVEVTDIDGTGRYDSATLFFYGPQKGKAQLAKTAAVYLNGDGVCDPDKDLVKDKVVVFGYMDITCTTKVLYGALERAGAKAGLGWHRAGVAGHIGVSQYDSWDRDRFTGSSLLLGEFITPTPPAWQESMEANQLEIAVYPPHRTAFVDHYLSWEWILFMQVVLPLLHFFAAVEAWREFLRQGGVSLERGYYSSAATAAAGSLSPTAGSLSQMKARQISVQADHFAAMRLCCALEVASMGLAGIWMACGMYGINAAPIFFHGWFFTILLGGQIFGGLLLATVMQEKLNMASKAPGVVKSTFFRRHKVRLSFYFVFMIALDGATGYFESRGYLYISPILDLIYFFVMFFFWVAILACFARLLSQARSVARTANSMKGSTNVTALTRVSIWLSRTALATAALFATLTALPFLYEGMNPRGMMWLVFTFQFTRVAKSYSQTQAMRPAGCENPFVKVIYARLTQRSGGAGSPSDEEDPKREEGGEGRDATSMSSIDGTSDSFLFNNGFLGKRLSTIYSGFASSLSNDPSGNLSSTGENSKEENPAVETESRRLSVLLDCCCPSASGPIAPAVPHETPSAEVASSDRSDAAPRAIETETGPGVDDGSGAGSSSIDVASEAFTRDQLTGLYVEGIAGFVEF